VVTDVLGQDRVVTGLEPAGVPTQPSDTIRIAERAWTRALESCASRIGLDSPEAVAAQMRQANGAVRMHCCRELAEQIAASLRSSHQDIQAIFAPDCGTCPQGVCADGGLSSAPSVHLLIWAQLKTPALGLRTAALGNALARVCQDTIGTQESPTLLHTQVIDDGDLQKLFGAGHKERWPMRLQAYLLSMNEVVEEVGTRGRSL
jgi:hypothetical protein